MAVRFNVTPKHAAEQYALNRAEQRREAWGATSIPTRKNTGPGGDSIDSTPPKKSLVEPRRGGPTDAELARAFWRSESEAASALVSALQAGPIHMSAVLDSCAVVAARDSHQPTVKNVQFDVRLRLEQALREATKSPELRMNAIKSLLHVAETTIANPESSYADLSTALVYVDLARRAVIPDASDARLRSSIQKKAVAFDALADQGTTAFRAKAESLIVQAEESVTSPYPDCIPPAGLKLIEKARRFLTEEQGARVDTVLVVHDVKRYAATDEAQSKRVLELAGSLKFQEAYEFLKALTPALAGRIDQTGGFLTDAEKDAAREAFAAHDALVKRTVVAFHQLHFLANVRDEAAGHC